MNASDVIAMLSSLIDRHGDLPVHFQDDQEPIVAIEYYAEDDERLFMIEGGGR